MHSIVHCTTALPSYTNTTYSHITYQQAAFYYALKRVKSEFVLFLENDFKMDLTLSQPHIMSELIGAAGRLLHLHS